jgi:hypothetical protein
MESMLNIHKRMDQNDLGMVNKWKLFTFNKFIATIFIKKARAFVYKYSLLCIVYIYHSVTSCFTMYIQMTTDMLRLSQSQSCRFLIHDVFTGLFMTYSSGYSWRITGCVTSVKQPSINEIMIGTTSSRISDQPYIKKSLKIPKPKG